MPIERHLLLQEFTLPPAGEWLPDGHCWTAVRVAAGVGYCLFCGSARELKAGDVLIIGPNTGVVLRASQLGEMKFEFFFVAPQSLNGLITVAESHQLEHLSSQTASCIFHFAADETTAQKFARLVALPQRDNLFVRSSLLQLWTSCVTTLLKEFRESGASNGLHGRFRQLLGKVSEVELAGSSLKKLATRLQCSERHFSRMFSEEFGISFRARQTEARMQMACQLLSDSDAKISQVAYESGYRHLSLFNAMFKKRFGFTPSQWRHQNQTAQANDSAEHAGARAAEGGIRADRTNAKVNPESNVSTVAQICGQSGMAPGSGVAPASARDNTVRVILKSDSPDNNPTEKGKTNSLSQKVSRVTVLLPAKY